MTINNSQHLLHAASSTVESHTIWQASLSTMWAKNNFYHLVDFFTCALDLGFTAIELNHQVNSQMLSGIDLKQYPIHSIHEPCPVDISTEILRARDWQVSALDEENRRQGLGAVKRSIDFAQQIGVSMMVIHLGQVSMDKKMEYELRRLFDEGKKDSPQYIEIKTSMEIFRASQAEQRLRAVHKSLLELIDYAGQAGVHLAIENRYHYFDIPLPDEMAELLALANDGRVGFLYDTGHAYTLDQMGFCRQGEWLERFGNRIMGMHLHDVVSLDDHYAPGMGGVDFNAIAQFIPQSAFRTCELRSQNTREEILSGMQKLVDAGCIQC